MSIVVTGATGQLGRLAVESLLARGVPAAEIVATGRATGKLADLAERGVVVRRADFDDPASLPEALAGAEKLLLVSGSEPGRRLPQHTAAITAAKDAGVRLIAYTSIAHADTSGLALAEDHRRTEEVLAASGVPYALLRNSWYLENYTGQLLAYLQRGIVGAAGNGRVSAATRADYAEAAAAVLTGEGSGNTVHELGGPAFTMTELAAAVSGATGQQVTYTDLPVEQYRQVLVGAGMPEPVAAMLADNDRGVAAGELFVGSGDLEKLLGRPATSLAQALADALAAARRP
jgi:NAD(P)H dehydrogenase (quinone)